MTVNRTIGYSAPGQQYLLVIDGGPAIPLESASITETEHRGGGLFAPPRETIVEVTTQGNGMMVWSPPPDELNRLRAQVAELRSWLSGVQPVEDEIPGLYWCGVCFKNLQMHADGCPAAGV